jgi:hypothetical protein
MALESIVGGTSMRIIAALLLVGLAAGAPLAAAQSTDGGDTGRFSFKEVPDGLLRLDTRTGQVSLCSKVSEWACRTLADDRAALESEIGRLIDENTALRKQLEARAAPQASPNGPAPVTPVLPPAATPPNGPAPSPQAAPKSGERDLTLPSDKDIDRMMAVLEKMWRRLLDMADRTRREFEQDHPDLHKNKI